MSKLLDNRGLLVIVMIIISVAACGFQGFMVNDHDAIEAMETAGYTDVEVTGKTILITSLVGCGEGDAAKFSVTARNPQGDLVTNAYVCVGWPFKGSTIRFR